MWTSFRSFRGAGRLLPLLAVLAAAATACPARAQSYLDFGLEEVAKDVKKLLDGRTETAINVGQFVPLPSVSMASAGPAIARGLTEELAKLKIDVRSDAGLTVEGRYGLAQDEKAHLMSVQLKMKIVDKEGDEIIGLKVSPRAFFGDSTIATLLGLTVDLSPNATRDGLDKKIQSSVDKPQARLEKTRISTPGGAPYSLEVLVKSGDKFVPRAAQEKGGQAFVELKADEVYRVRVVNDADYEVAVSLSIDGLNMFTFSELKDPKTGKPSYDRLLVKAHGAFDVPGWHRNNDKNGSNEFQVTKYADSEAAKLYPNSANVGTITVTFAAAWPLGVAPPADEPLPPLADDLGTKRGAPTGDGYKEVERQFGVTRAAISVRYSK